MKCQDPTREEMRATLDAWPFIKEADEFDIESAIYWFASDWHGGQFSNLYSALSTSPYEPGALESHVPDDGMAAMLYDVLQSAFVDETKQN